ncbi:MAG: S-methyl-5-thioribose-1-phosphate isomerase [Gemmataceae bacterium]|nr:S-methyl-5-thioribose-1-phosphate isomerase [Gemmataceae bacterium]
MQLPKTLQWIGGPDGFLRLLDQTQLPLKVVFKDCKTVEEVHEAIRSLRVRGAPAIGVAAAMGCVIGLQVETQASLENRFLAVDQFLRTSRPTAVNLFWALDRMGRKFQQILPLKEENVLPGLLQEALEIEEEDRQMCLAIGLAGLELVPDHARILTHCNTGSLATAGRGTALSVVFAAFDSGKLRQVFCDETRPLFQGARLTAWELLQAGIPTTLICDSMAAQVMKEGKVDLVITGADRIAANGDSANKIGTYGLAILARAHALPFYIAAPSSTFDLSLANGSGIPIEERAPDEVTSPGGVQVAPEGIAVYNPAFDVTPASLISAIITEKGVIRPVSEAAIRCLLAG